MSPEKSAQHYSAHITTHSLLIPTIEAWRIYLQDQDNSPHTVKAFLGDLRLLASSLPSDRPLGQISTTDLNNFLEWMQHVRRVPCSPKTLSRRITSLKAFFRWLHTNGVIAVDPAERVVQKSVISPLPEVLSPEEIQAVLEKAGAHLRSDNPDTRYYTLAALLLSTGVKKGECLAISPNHIDLEAPGGALLFIRYANPQQRYKERKISLPQEWVEAFPLYRAQYTLEDRLFPWSQRRLEYLLEDLGVETGLNKHLSFDMCRWSCALTDWLSGMERDKIRQKLGISRVQWREVSLKLEQLAR
jgi:site-specific recombinase XerD